MRGYDRPQLLERGPVTNSVFKTFWRCRRLASRSPRTSTARSRRASTTWGAHDRRGKRLSVAGAFLHPAERRPNLEVRTGCLITKLLLDGKRVHGGAPLRGQGPAPGRREGGQGRAGQRHVRPPPQLLQLSGIGNAAELAALAVVQDLPGVGEHLQDHMVAKIQHSATQAVTIDPQPLALAAHRPAVAGDPPWIAAANIYEGGGLVRAPLEITYPDLLLGFSAVGDAVRPAHPRPRLPARDGGPGASPAARGTVKITSTDQVTALRFNYLGVDRRFWVDAVHIARDVLDQPAFQGG